MTRGIDVDLPVRSVYDQWTQLEELPRFLPDRRIARRRTSGSPNAGGR